MYVIAIPAEMDNSGVPFVCLEYKWPGFQAKSDGSPNSTQHK